MKMIIGGKWVDRTEKIEVLNPYDGSVVDLVPRGTKDDIDQAIKIAQKGFEINKEMPIHKRIGIIKKAADLMQERFEELAKTISSEGSKTINEARKEVRRAINTINLSAEEARRINGETLPFDSAEGSENRVGYYYRVPIGIIGAITPFNDPLNLVAHKIGPAIAAGNSIVVKPATVTPLSALKLAECFLDAGLPGEIISVVTGKGSEIGNALVSDDRIRMITFTGGVEAGENITKNAGIKKLGLELGANSPVIVMHDCDMELAVDSCVSGAFWAAGQNCIGVQRIYVHKKIYEEFRNKFVEKTKRIKTGYQQDEDTNMGPMITENEAKRVIDWVEEAVKLGAFVLTGGTRKGTLVQPTVLENIAPGSKLDCQEVFGPVVSLYPVDDLDMAIKKSNAVDFGLHGAIFTNNIKNAFYAIHRMEVGGMMVNDSTDYRIDLMPFGGTKRSGLGREGVRYSIQEMTETKVVCFNL